MDILAPRWRDSFFEELQRAETASPLKQASLDADMRAWTASLTDVVVAVCDTRGWKTAAKGHRLDYLPEQRNEYLGLDVTAFPSRESRWSLPIAVFELENSPKDDRIAYSLWKVLCVRAPLRVVFCYRRDPEDIPGLVGALGRDMVEQLAVEERTHLAGEIIVVVGSRADASTFPYGFFRWWELEQNTSRFRLM